MFLRFATWSEPYVCRLGSAPENGSARLNHGGLTGCWVAGDGRAGPRCGGPAEPAGGGGRGGGRALDRPARPRQLVNDPRAAARGRAGWNRACARAGAGCVSGQVAHRPAPAEAIAPSFPSPKSESVRDHGPERGHGRSLARQGGGGAWRRAAEHGRHAGAHGPGTSPATAAPAGPAPRVRLRGAQVRHELPGRAVAGAQASLALAVVGTEGGDDRLGRSSAGRGPVARTGPETRRHGL